MGMLTVGGGGLDGERYGGGGLGAQLDQDPALRLQGHGSCGHRGMGAHLGREGGLGWVRHALAGRWGDEQRGAWDCGMLGGGGHEHLGGVGGLQLGVVTSVGVMGNVLRLGVVTSGQALDILMGGGDIDGGDGLSGVGAQHHGLGCVVDIGAGAGRVDLGAGGWCACSGSWWGSCWSTGCSSAS